MLSSNIMKGTSSFVCLALERLQLKCALQFSKDVGKSRRDFRKKPEENLYLQDGKEKQKDTCLLKNVLTHRFQEVFMNSFLASKQGDTWFK